MSAWRPAYAARWPKGGDKRLGVRGRITTRQVLNRARDLGIVVGRNFSVDEVAVMRDYRPSRNAPKDPPRGERNPRHKPTDREEREIRRSWPRATSWRVV